MRFLKKWRSKYITLSATDGGKNIEGLDPESLRSPLESRYAVLGDIHANLEALTAVLADIKGQGITSILCTGDLVGYGANPSECIEIIRDLNCPVVKGNHDSYAATDDSLKDFNLNAMNAILWTREQLSTEERLWLESLPLQRECRILNAEQGMTKEGLEMCASEIDLPSSIQLVHSSLIDPARWRYIMKPEKAEPALRAQDPDLVFFGHTHVPTLYSYNPEAEEFRSQFPLPEGTHSLASGWKHLVNPGSVGQPRDRDTRASYAMYDSGAQTIKICRVDYDIAATQKKIEASGLPLRNAERLSKGR